MARPAKPIDAGTVQGLARLGCSLDEAGVVLDLTSRQLRTRFKADAGLQIAWRRGDAEGRMSLRRHLMTRAFKSDVVLIHLAKTRLGHVETGHIEHVGKDGDAIKIDASIEGKELFTRLLDEIEAARSGGHCGETKTGGSPVRQGDSQ